MFGPEESGVQIDRGAGAPVFKRDIRHRRRRPGGSGVGAEDVATANFAQHRRDPRLFGHVKAMPAPCVRAGGEGVGADIDHMNLGARCGEGLRHRTPDASAAAGDYRAFSR